MAAELHRLITGEEARSAGTKVGERDGETLRDIKEEAWPIIECMKEIGVDVLDNVRTQVTPEIARTASRIFVMAEPETVPEWLRSDPKTEMWTVLDPKGPGVTMARKAREDIRRLILESLENA